MKEKKLNELRSKQLDDELDLHELLRKQVEVKLNAETRSSKLTKDKLKLENVESLFKLEEKQRLNIKEDILNKEYESEIIRDEEENLKSRKLYVRNQEELHRKAIEQQKVALAYYDNLEKYQPPIEHNHLSPVRKNNGDIDSYSGNRPPVNNKNGGIGGGGNIPQSGRYTKSFLESRNDQKMRNNGGFSMSIIYLTYISWIYDIITTYFF